MQYAQFRTTEKKKTVKKIPTLQKLTKSSYFIFYW